MLKMYLWLGKRVLFLCLLVLVGLVGNVEKDNWWVLAHVIADEAEGDFHL